MNNHPDCYKTIIYLPIIAAAPPGDPEAYYAQLPVTAAALPSGDHDGLRITITYPVNTTVVQLIGEPLHSVPFSTVFTIAGGFVTFYTDSKPFELPGGEKLPVSAGPPASDVGTIVLNIWGADFQEFDRRLAPSAQRPTTVVYRGVQTTTVRQSLAGEVAKMPKKALIKSWQGGGGQGTEPDEATLRQLHLDRIMTGDGSVFVTGGVPIGEAATSTSGANKTAEFLLHAFSNDAAGNAVFMSPMPLILATGTNHA